MGSINLQKMISDGKKNYLVRAGEYVKRYGVKGIVYKAFENYQRTEEKYSQVYEKFLPDAEELKRQREALFCHVPLISIVVPAYETNAEYLCRMMDSIVQQTYTNWQLVIADGSSTDTVESVVRGYIMQIESDSIIYKRLSENKGISVNTNEALKLARGEYIGFLDHDDFLEKNALYEVVKRINEVPQAELFYSDEDKVSADAATYMQPHFKPDFNAELLRSMNYICHFLVVAKPLLERVGEFNPEYDGAQDYDFILRCTEQAKGVEHIAKVLYHWRVHAGSTSGSGAGKMYAYEAGRKAIMEHLRRIGEDYEVKIKADFGCYRVMYRLKNFAQLTVVIFDKKKEEPRIYARLRSLGAVIKYVKEERTPLMWEVATRYVLVLEKAHYMPKEEELMEMMGIIHRREVGAVGTKSVLKSGRVAQNGFVLFENGLVRPAFEQLKKNYKGYMRRAELTQYVEGISFSCAMLKKEAMDLTGGFLPGMPKPYREMDFCLQLKNSGFKIAQDSYIVVEMEEPERISQIEENQSRLMLRERWGDAMKGKDIFYNVNFERGNAQFQI